MCSLNRTRGVAGSNPAAGILSINLKMNEEIIVRFDRIGYDGASIGRFNKKIVFSYGILPGEIAKIKVTRKKRNFIEGELLEILEESKYRVKERESHYLSCSPWQTFDYNFQVELKNKILQEIFSDADIKPSKFFKAKKIFEYRTKIEYSFYENDQTYFAFYKKKNPFEKVILEKGCLLFDTKANEVALDLLEQINKNKLKNLKSLIIRRSVHFPYLHFSLLTKDKKIDFNFRNDKLTGFAIIYSDPQSPASVFTEVLTKEGKEEILEKVGSLKIRYPYSSFFQNNLELLEKALVLMKKNLDKANKIVDLYCGVGVLGLFLAKDSKEVLGVDIDEKAIEFARINARENNIKNFRGIALASEKIQPILLKNTDLLILDPPRAGLHKKVINLIEETKPKKIFYLSCNPITQARDYSLIKDHYEVEKLYGFDFYPNTPHIETLLILSSK